MFYDAETHRDGVIQTGEVLFTSETNNVDVRFTSDYTERRTGFTLDIRSALCSELVYPEEDENSSKDCDDITAQELVIVAGEVLRGVLVTDTEYDGHYSNYACQNWNIMADENQV